MLDTLQGVEMQLKGVTRSDVSTVLVVQRATDILPQDNAVVHYGNGTRQALSLTAYTNHQCRCRGASNRSELHRLQTRKSTISRVQAELRPCQGMLKSSPIGRPQVGWRMHWYRVFK